MSKLTFSHEFFGYFILSLPDGFLLFPELFLLVPQLFLSDPLLHQLLFSHKQHFLLSLQQQLFLPDILESLLLLGSEIYIQSVQWK